MEVGFDLNLDMLVGLWILWVRREWVDRQGLGRGCPSTESMQGQPGYARGSTGRWLEGGFLRKSGR